MPQRHNHIRQCKGKGGEECSLSHDEGYHGHQSDHLSSSTWPICILVLKRDLIFFRATHYKYRVQNSCPNSFYFKILRAFRVQCVWIFTIPNTCRGIPAHVILFFFVFSYLILLVISIKEEHWALYFHMYVCLSEKELCKTFFSSLNIVQGRQVGNQGISDLLERGVRGFGYAHIVNSKVNRCLAQYSLRATTTNQLTNKKRINRQKKGKKWLLCKNRPWLKNVTDWRTDRQTCWGTFTRLKSRKKRRVTTKKERVEF